MEKNEQYLEEINYIKILTENQLFKLIVELQATHHGKTAIEKEIIEYIESMKENFKNINPKDVEKAVRDALKKALEFNNRD